jgi:hypothetical protein
MCVAHGQEVDLDSFKEPQEHKHAAVGHDCVALVLLVSRAAADVGMAGDDTCKLSASGCQVTLGSQQQSIITLGLLQCNC